MDKLLKQLKKLDFPKDSCAIFGSGPMAIRGLREAKDLDVIVNNNLWKEMQERFNSADEKIIIGEIELFNTWKDLDVSVEELIDSADIIDGIRYVKLGHVLEWKKNLKREKDLEDIWLIESYLKNKN